MAKTRLPSNKNEVSPTESNEPPTKTIAFRVPTRVHSQIHNAARAKNEDIGTYILSQIDKQSELGEIMRLEAQRAWETTRDIAKVVSHFLVDLNELRDGLGMTFEEFNSIVGPGMKEFLDEKKKQIEEKRKEGN